MTTLPIARMGQAVLRGVAPAVEDPTAPEIARLAELMRETMIAAGGVGLAAPQVFAPVRVIVFEAPPGRARSGDAGAPDGPVPFTVLINPEIEVLDPTQEFDWEGCLSAPGLVGLTPRARRIGYRGHAPDGRLIEREAAGFHARVVQHERDHLDGVLYIQRMTDLRTLSFVEEARALVEAKEQPPATEARP